MKRYPDMFPRLPMTDCCGLIPCSHLEVPKQKVWIVEGHWGGGSLGTLKVFDSLEKAQEFSKDCGEDYRYEIQEMEIE